MKRESAINELRPTSTPGASSAPRELGEAAQGVIESVGHLSRQVETFLTRQAAERPKVLFACAVGLGFVLGGGLASRTGALVRMGGRLALLQGLQRWMDGSHE